MTPTELDLKIWRGTSFELELVSQVKNYIYDPDVHNTLADQKRSHKQNQEYYGYTYDYVDFASLYAEAELRVIRSWIKAGNPISTPLLTLTDLDGSIELTARSIKIGLSPDDTKGIEFDSGKYELVLTTASGKKDAVTFGDVTVLGEKQ